ncbi:MAG: alpha beta fold family [Lasallia pustulata]|uniref:alcohol O-acetyltransferase n=1 Tax=Lasallia pustulata TaxID=136370 RepID=A0A5M8PDF3_9LECA|nr:MAG: alpha beta fold family [Lasallia pustulata]
MDLGWLLGHAKTTFHHHAAPLHLRTKAGSSTDLLKICEAATPPCRLNPLLFNGHLQSLWTAVTPQDIPIYYKRHVFSASDPAYAGTFAVDFVVPPYGDTDASLPPRTTHFTDKEFDGIGSLDTKPMLITLHGLSGGSYEIYLRHVLVLLGKANWEACVVNSRGCANSVITSPLLFSARATWDVRQVVKWLKKTFPNRPLFAIGYSLGANILTNYLGEEGGDCVLKAAVVVSNPWNLETGNQFLQRSWIGREVYSSTLGTHVKKLFDDHFEELSKIPQIDVEKVRKIKYLHEFDRYVQGPTWGYPTENAYYRDASSSDSLLAVKIPLFAINAEDDPIAAKEAIPFGEFKQNPYTVLCTTSVGGHLGWFETAGGRWFAKPATQFLMKMAEGIDRPAEDRGDGRISPKNAEVAANRPDYNPMRRKLQMHIEP